MDTDAHQYPQLPQNQNVKEPDNWKYAERGQMQEIVPDLFLGSYATASKRNLSSLTGAGITHVVCVRCKAEANLIRPVHEDRFKYLIVDMENNYLDSIIPKIRTISQFIDDCLSSGGKVLVHGNAGIYRSPSLVIGYIMSKYGILYKNALTFVTGKRHCINVPVEFRRQLLEYESIFKAAHDTPPTMMDLLTQTKRKHCDEHELD